MPGLEPTSPPHSYAGTISSPVSGVDRRTRTTSSTIRNHHAGSDRAIRRSRGGNELALHCSCRATPGTVRAETSYARRLSRKAGWRRSGCGSITTLGALGVEAGCVASLFPTFHIQPLVKSPQRRISAATSCAVHTKSFVCATASSTSDTLGRGERDPRSARHPRRSACVPRRHCDGRTRDGRGHACNPAAGDLGSAAREPSLPSGRPPRSPRLVCNSCAHRVGMSRRSGPAALGAICPGPGAITLQCVADSQSGPHCPGSDAGGAQRDMIERCLK